MNAGDKKLNSINAIAILIMLLDVRDISRLVIAKVEIISNINSRRSINFVSGDIVNDCNNTKKVISPGLEFFQ